MLRRITIGRHERGFLHRGRDFVRYLAPGTHWAFGFELGLVRADATGSEPVNLDHLDLYLRDADVQGDVTVADLTEDERALVWIDGRIARVIGPGRHVFWSVIREVRLEVYRASELRFEHPQLQAILAAAGGRAHLQEVIVPPGSKGLLYVDEALHDELTPGRYAFWQGVARVAVRVVDLREATLDVAGQEILTADRVSLRVNLAATYQILDPRVAAERTADVSSALYRELQLALRESVGTRTLDELLAAKDAVSREILEAVGPRAKAHGAALGAVGIKDVILPGEMKLLLNQVIEAEKRAQANLIARREETAATRSLLNTAKLIESSPTLLRLKELEAAERIAGSIDSLQVYGSNGLEALVQQLLPKA